MECLDSLESRLAANNNKWMDKIWPRSRGSTRCQKW